jgi:hypothetical protein
MPLAKSSTSCSTDRAVPPLIGTYAHRVGSRIINGEDWIQKRLKFLRERLAGELPDEERRVLEQEIEALSKEPGIMPSGMRFPRLWRRRCRTH